jgi:hypothetical protein
MEPITIEGIVPETFENQKEFYLRVTEKDLSRASKFIEQTNTNFRSGSIAVRKKSIVSKCNAGDLIELTVGTQRRKDGIRLKTIDFKKIKSA